jgi:hypothetical protein
MNLVPVLKSSDLGGLFELDSEGTVFYSKLRKNKLLFDTESDMVGCNFFDEVAAFENVNDFKQRFKYFVKSSDSMENFNFDFRDEEMVVPVRVMLVRVGESAQDGHTKLIIVDIRKI